MTNIGEKLAAMIEKDNERKKTALREIVQYNELISIYQKEIAYRERLISIIEELEYVYKNTI